MGQDTQAPAASQVSGVEQLGKDLGTMAQTGASAIATAWSKYLAPHANVIVDDLAHIAADGRRKWADVSKVVNHPVDHGAEGVSRFFNGALSYATGKNSLLKDGSAFIAETGAAFVQHAAEGLIDDAKAVKKGVDYVAARVQSFQGPKP